MILTCLFLTLLPSFYRTKDRLLGFGEDLFIAFQQVTLLYIGGKNLFIPLALLQGLYLVDAFLYSKMGLRLHLSHFRFLKTPKLFLDSVLARGLLTWCCLSLGVISITYSMFIFTFSPTNPFFLLAAIPLFFSYKKVKTDHNTLFLLQLQFFQKPKTPILQPLPKSLIPQCEKFTKIDPHYPLLKITTGFEGPFQLKVHKTKPKNILCIFLESFRSCSLNDRVTPHFNHLTKKGAFFENFYANGVLTKYALWTTLAGLPPFYGNTLLKKPDDLPLITLSSILKQEGYYNLFIDSCSLSLDHQGQFLKNHSFDEIIGKEALEDLTITNSSTSWGVHDEFLFDRALKKIESLKDKPLFTTLFTISNHDPWWPPHNYNLDPFEDIKDPLYRNFLKTMHYTDHCLHQFLKHLNLKDTLLIILGDHGVHMCERNHLPGERSLYKESLHVPLLLYNEVMIPDPTIIKDPGSQTDLLATIMDLLDLQGLNHSIGTSLLRKADRILFFHDSLHDKSSLCKSSDNYHTYPINNPDDKTLIENVSTYISTLFANKQFTFTPITNTIAFEKENSFITDQAIKLLTEQYPNLEVLHIPKSPLITDVGFNDIVTHFPKLKSINLSYNTDITGQSLPKKLVPWLFAEFLKCPKLTETGILNIFQIAPYLKKLAISCYTLNEDLLSKLPNLSTLHLTHCSHLTGAFLENLPSINHLTLHNVHNLCSLDFLKNKPLYSLTLSEANQLHDLTPLHHLPLEKFVLSKPTPIQLHTLPNPNLLALTECDPSLQPYLEKLNHKRPPHKKLLITYDPPLQPDSSSHFGIQ